jgi:5-methylcytosine-specific restriction protein A
MPTAPKRACLVPGCLGYAETRGRCAEHAKPIVEALARARRDEPGRQWYHTTRWRKLRQTLLSRRPLCVRCEAEGRPTPATDIDHIVPHRGDANLFWSSRNMQGLCQAHHIQKTREERRA